MLGAGSGAVLRGLGICFTFPLISTLGPCAAICAARAGPVRDSRGHPAKRHLSRTRRHFALSSGKGGASEGPLPQSTGGNTDNLSCSIPVQPQVFVEPIENK
jgi:hypothetical protein